MIGRWPPSGTDVDGPLRELRGRRGAGRTVPQIARDVAAEHGLVTVEPREILAPQEYSRYRSAADAGDWRGADLMYAERLAIRRPAAFGAVRHAEIHARALNVILNESLARIRVLRRWIDPAELESYKHGTFESRIEADGGRRGCKLFSMGRNEYSKMRAVEVAVPVDARIRRAARTADYTALPRIADPSKERMDDKKHIRHAGETECRVPDGTSIPRGTQIRVDLGKIPRADMGRLRSIRDSLEGVADVYFD